MTDYRELAQWIIDNDPAVVGVRSLQKDEHYEIGDYCRESYEWDWENDCSAYDINGEDGEKAGGACATIIKNDTWDIDKQIEEIKKAMKYNSEYSTGRQVIIAGRPNIDGVFDQNECRIIDAKVIAVIE